MIWQMLSSRRLFIKGLGFKFDDERTPSYDSGNLSNGTPNELLKLPFESFSCLKSVPKGPFKEIRDGFTTIMVRTETSHPPSFLLLSPRHYSIE